MLKVSSVLFIILQQKESLILSQLGETIGLGEDGGQHRCALGRSDGSRSAPWARSGGVLAGCWGSWQLFGRLCHLARGYVLS